MKQFIANVLRITILSFICFITIDVCILFYKDEKSLYSHEKNVLLAYNRLKALQDTTKIVIIAGSNGGFSINSRMISNAFHMPVVNTSTHAGIGVRMQFEIYKDLLHKGDVIIFCPEYGNGKNRLYGETTLLRILSTQLPSAYKKLSARQWLFIHKYIGLYFNGICKHFGQKPFDGPYSVKALNEYGDIEWERPHQDSIKLESFNGQLEESLIDYYKYVHQYTHDKGIKLLFFPPTFMETSYQLNEMQIDSMQQRLRQSGIGWQSEPKKYSFPDSLYFDTPYHMTQAGANKRTQVLIDDMLRLLHIQK